MDTVRPLISPNILALIDNKSAGGIFSKPYTTRQEAELAHLERWEQAKRIESEQEFYGPFKREIPVHPVEHYERLRKKDEQDEQDRQTRQLVIKHGSKPSVVIKTDKKLELEDFL